MTRGIDLLKNYTDAKMQAIHLHHQNESLFLFLEIDFLLTLIKEFLFLFFL